MIFLKDRHRNLCGPLSTAKAMARDRMLLIQDPDLLMPRRTSRRHECLRAPKTASCHRIIKDRSVLDDRTRHEFVEDIATKVTVLHQGQILSEGTDGEGEERSQGESKFSSDMISGAHRCWAISDYIVAYCQSEVHARPQRVVAPNEIRAIMGRTAWARPR